MKIAIVTPRLHVAGGVERASVTIANYFENKLHYQVTLVTKHTGQSFYALNKSIVAASAYLKPSRSMLARFFNTIFWFFWLGRWLRKEAPEFDYIIANSAPVASYLLFWKLVYRSRSSIIVCEHISFQQAGFFWKISRQWLYPYATNLISLTKSDLKNYLKINSHAIYLPNPVDIPSNQQRNRDNFTVLNIGRLEYQKGQDMLLLAWQIVHNRHPNWRLVIVGEGSKRKYLEKLILKFNLANSVEILKPTTNVEKLYQSSAMFVLSSRYEGLPVTLLEAQAHGLPCVSFNCPTGPGDILCDQENGFLVEPNNTQQLAEHICQVIETERYDELSQKAKFSAERFRTDRIMNDWKALLESNR